MSSPTPTPLADTSALAAIMAHFFNWLPPAISLVSAFMGALWMFLSVWKMLHVESFDGFVRWFSRLVMHLGGRRKGD